MLGIPQRRTSAFHHPPVSKPVLSFCRCWRAFVCHSFFANEGCMWLSHQPASGQVILRDIGARHAASRCDAVSGSSGRVLKTSEDRNVALQAALLQAPADRDTGSALLALTRFCHLPAFAGVAQQRAAKHSQTPLPPRSSPENALDQQPQGLRGQLHDLARYWMSASPGQGD